jgi:catechol 2,3-dioxygenase-like lactoylglutathione lyase family enzyme
MGDEAASATGITGIGTVGVPVSDHDRAIDFYVGTLGLEKRLDAEFAPGQRWVEVAPAGAATTVALAPAPPGSPIGVDTGVRFRTTSADDDHARLKAAGVGIDPEVMHWPGVPPMFSLRDPDGNTLYLVESGS